MDLPKLFSKQISLTEWFAAIHHKDTDALRDEDNEKRERLKVLNEVIGLPYDTPTQFSGSDLAGRTEAVQRFLKEHGQEHCALRLIPLDPSLPKLRMRGKTVTEAMGWFAEQQIDSTKYRADFVPHPTEPIWATIFVVTPNGVIGEIIHGGHHQLTQGLYDEGKPFLFQYDFATQQLLCDEIAAVPHLHDLFQYLTVVDESVQQTLREKLNATFAFDMLCGYFETVFSKDFGTHFIDYNRVLDKVLPVTTVQHSSEDAKKNVLVSGMCGSPGTAEGTVKIVTDENFASVVCSSSDILVCRMTTPQYLLLMRECAGIVTDEGGILSHAAIVARELGTPCVIATGNATSVLKDGMHIHVDANNGSVLKG